MSTATCVIMKEVFRQGIQCAIVFPSNVYQRATSLVIFLFGVFFMCLFRFADLGISFAISQLFQVFVSVFISLV